MSGIEDALPLNAQRWVEALSWHETLIEADETKLTSAVAYDWQKWYADAGNQRLFDDLSRLIADVGRVRPGGYRYKRDVAEDEYEPSVSVEAWRRASARKQARLQDRPARKWRLWLPWGGAIAVMAALAALIPLRSWIGAPGNGVDFLTVLQTRTGEIRSARLSDGSSITLGGETELAVDLSNEVRSVRLIRGEAWFRVAHDRKWPFVVHAGDGAIRAVGTAFLVTRDSDRVTVTVTEGIVAVTPSRLVKLLPDFDRGGGLLRPIRVAGGEEVSYRDNGAVASVKNADMHAATAWTSGRLIFNGEQLRYVIEAVDRYSPRHVSATRAVGGLRFSGVIFHDGIGDWIQGLSGIFPVQIDQRGSNVCVSMKETQADPACTAAR
jgi:transmembrane sensor